MAGGSKKTEPDLRGAQLKGKGQSALSEIQDVLFKVNLKKSN